MLLALALTASPALAGIPAGFGGTPGIVTEATPHYDLELLYHDSKFEDGLKEADRQIAATPNDADLYWHAARFMFEIGERFDRTDKSIDKEAHYKKMDDYCEKGLAIDPNNMHLLFAKGIALGRLGTTRGVLSSLFLAQDVENSWLKVAESDYSYASIGGEEIIPCDDYLTLGIFYRLVPESWLIQAIAGTRGDLQKSVDYNRKADQCAPNRIGTMKELGASLMCYGQKHNDDASIQEAMKILSRTTSLVPEEQNDFIDIKHAAMLMSTPKNACGYSRDGQQDLDEKQLAKDKAAKEGTPDATN